MIYPILYKANEVNFSTLGLGALTEGKPALVTEERNGQFFLEMEYPIGGLHFKELKLDRLIKANASPILREQRFKIVRITKPSKGFVTIYAEHVSNHTAELQLKPEVNYSGNANNALTMWKNNIVGEHPFTVYSDIETSGSGKWEIDEVENARRALGGVQGSILDAYGGEYRFDNYHIMLLNNRGNDNGVPIMYGKNLIDLEQEEEIKNTHTSVMPYAKHLPEDADEHVTITLPEYYVDSEHIDNYARRNILQVDFTADEIKTVAELRSRTERFIKDNDIGIPRVNLRVKFVDLAKTLNYKDVAKIENIGLCDLVPVYFKRLGVNTKAKVVTTIFNHTLDRYEEIEIGQVRASLSDSISTTVDGKLEEVQSSINRVQLAANQKNRVFRGPDEPTSGMSPNDLWYKPVGDGEIEMYRWDGEMWRKEKVSGGLIAGTLDAGSGDLDIINLNAENIVTGEIRGIAGYFGSGTIGAWDIGPTRLTSGTTNIASVTDGGYAFWAGHKTASEAPFSIGHSGRLITETMFAKTIRRRTYGTGPATVGVKGDSFDAVYSKEVNGGNWYFDETGGEVPRIRSNNIHIGTTGGAATIGTQYSRFGEIFLHNPPDYPSDGRIKRLIQDIPDSLVDRLSDIKPMMYKKDGRDDWEFGYIAQDVERVIYQETLKTKGYEKAKSFLEDFSVVRKYESYLSLVYGEIAVLKDAQHTKEINSLKQRVSELEGLLNE